MRDERLACWVTLQMKIAHESGHCIGKPVRQMTSGGVEGDSGEHRGVHHLGTRFDVARVADGPHEVSSNAFQGFGRQAIRERIRTL